jgi:hypothetical protein
MREVFMYQTRLFKRYVFATVIVGLALFCVGMGGLGEQDPTKIPEPAQDFSATVVDQRDIASDITLMSLEGQTFLVGKRGGATVSIPFENIEVIEFSMSGKDVYAAVAMKGQPQVELKVEKDRVLYGQLSYGNFAIKVEYIRKIIIHGATTQER